MVRNVATVFLLLAALWVANEWRVAPSFVKTPHNVAIVNLVDSPMVCFYLTGHSLFPDIARRAPKIFVGLPFWFALTILAGYPMLAFIRGPFRRFRRRRRGLCVQCGYNLTGNTTGVCPECGTQTCRDTEN